MKGTIALLLFMYLFYSAGVSQKVHFDLKVRVDYPTLQAHSSITESNIIRVTPIDDSTSIRTRILRTQNTVKNYTPDLGYGLKGMFSIHLSDRFFISPGLELKYLSYGIDTETYPISEVELESDTIIQQDPIILDPLCDVFENNFSEIGEVDRTIEQEILYLSIPFEFGYSIIPRKLDVQAGLFFQTPVYSLTQREYITLQTTESMDLTICSFEKVVEKNNSGNGFRDAQWGLNAEISYVVYNNIRLSLGIRKAMSNVYVDPEYQTHPLTGNSYKPFMWSAGIGYRFGSNQPGIE